MRSMFFMLSAAALVAFAACKNTNAEVSKTTAFPLDSVKAEIMASNVIFGKSFSNGDSASFVNCYTSDACINPSNMPRMCGTQAITAFFNGGYKMGIRNIKATTEEVMGGKEAVAETGTYELQDGKGTALDKGKYIVIWKEENGKWKMFRDEWNSDMPLPGMK